MMADPRPQPLGWTFSLLAVLSVLGYAPRSAWAVTPVEKVIQLLKRLDGELVAEGKRDAAQYDKYACFCKEQGDQRNYDILQANEKVERLGLEVSELEAEIALANTAISELGARITKLENEMKDMVGARSKQHNAYLKAAKDTEEAVAALEGGIRALKLSKQQMADTGLDLAQVSATVGPEVIALLEESASFSNTLAVSNSQQPNRYEYQSDNIIAMLQSLLKDFKEDKSEIDATEFHTRSVFDTRYAGYATEKGFSQKELSEKEQVLGMKTNDVHASQADKDAETLAKDADQSFMDELTAACDKRADEWDEHSQMRSAELAAIAQAIETIESGVIQNYAVNRKLVSLSAAKPLIRGGRSLLQVRLGGAARDEKVAQRVTSLLTAAAKRFGSSALSGLVLRMGLGDGADHFGKIRILIKNLISKLKGDATSEAETKGFCDKEMRAAITSRDNTQGEIEGTSAKIEQQKAEKADKIEQMQLLSQDVADASKALNEATQLRADDEDLYSQTVKSAREGKTATEQAIDILSSLGSSAASAADSPPAAAASAAVSPGSSLLQYKPPKADRSGKTPGSDLAPKKVSAQKHRLRGKIALQGIIGMLQVVLSDFEGTLAKAEDEEAEAKKDFARYEQETQADIAAKKQEEEALEADVTSLEESLVDNKDTLLDAEALRASNSAELSRLQAMCVDGQESWGERKEKREAELEALRQALGLLQDWKGSF